MVIMMSGRADAKRLCTVVGGLAVLSLLAACGSSTDGGTPSDEGTQATGEPSVTESAADETGLDFDGLVRIDDDKGDGEDPLLSVFEPESYGLDGIPVAEISIPYSLLDELPRSSFSHDWRYVTWGSESVQILKLDEANREYVKMLAIQPDEEGYSNIAESYENPRFGPDGHTLWIEKRVDDEYHLMSLEISPDADSSDLEDSGLRYPAPSMWEEEELPWTFDNAGKPIRLAEDDQTVISSRPDGRDHQDGDWAATYWTDSEGSVVNPSVRTWSDAPSATRYTVLRRTGPTEFIMIAESERRTNSSGGAQSTGLVMRVMFEPAAESIELESLVPLAANGELASWAVISPASDRVIFCMSSDDRGVLYRVALDEPGAEPDELADCTTAPPALDWP